MEPITPAQKFAKHLEQAYGVQLDARRHTQLVKEIQDFVDSLQPVTELIPLGLELPKA